MALVEFGAGAEEDLGRILDHWTAHDPATAQDRIREVIDGCALLEAHPLIGRPRADDKRELVIGSRARGYIALYRYVEAVDLVVILAIRAQSERGYARGL
jgi:plasmid stabilization system protein ParE